MVRLPQRPPDWSEILANLEPPNLLTVLGVGATPDGRYLHWDEVRRRNPPGGLTKEEWWAGMRVARTLTARHTPIEDSLGNHFTYSQVDPLLQRLHKLDLRATGRLAAPTAVVNPATRNRYRVTSLIEEAISSAQLEGAATTRRVAKELLRSQRRPTDTSERMIVNNYRAIRKVSDWARADLTSDMILVIHETLTRDTLEQGECGRFQQTGEKRVSVFDIRTGEVLHDPPPADMIPDQVAKLCLFANDGHESFLHPLVKATLLHFWLAFLHPFADGNGRTARALFYWSALRDGYWLMEYLSVSSVLRKAPARYARAFLYSETDSNDLTYFLLHQLDALEEAYGGLEQYIDKTLEQTRAAERVAGELPGLNHRQRDLIGHALRNPGHRYTYISHANSHDVVRQTARTDLLALVRRGLLEQSIEGRQTVFEAPYDLEARLKAARPGT